MTPMEESKITDEEIINKINDLKKMNSKILIKKELIYKYIQFLLNQKLILIGKNTIIPNFVKKCKLIEKIPIRIVK